MTLNWPTSLKLFDTRSLQFEIQRTVMSIFLVLVVTYSTGLGYYFAAGLDIASNVGLKTVAQSYQQRVRTNAESSPLMTGEFSADFQYDTLPEHVRQMFPLDSIIPGVPEIKLNTDATDKSDHLVFLLAEQLPDGNLLFLTKELDVNEGQISHGIFSLDFLEHAIFWAGAAFLVLVYLITRFMMQRINRHIRALQTWTDNLQISQGPILRPDFRYDELNKIAERLEDSVRRIGEFVDREQTFLRHASHELRTPIAIISGNVSVMNKLELDEHQAAVNDRIGRACHAMHTIVTTLLWLGRESQETPVSDRINLGQVLTRTIDEHRYLLAGKDITVETKLPDTFVNLPTDPLGIVLANLVRNAFQHTQAGDICIEIVSETVRIRNSTQSSEPIPIIFEESRGIGLSLVHRIAKRLGWNLSLSATDGYVTIILSFTQAEE